MYSKFQKYKIASRHGSCSHVFVAMFEQIQTLSIASLATCSNTNQLKKQGSSISFFEMSLSECHLAFFNMYLLLSGVIPVNA